VSLIVRATSGGGSFTPVPPGMHLARCYRIVDLGTQTSEYMGTTKKLPKVMLQFEVHSEDETGSPLVTAKGEPMSISKNYTASLSDMSTLRKDLTTWRGRDFTAEELGHFELEKILGQWAMISVTKSVGNNGKEYTNIANINPVPANIKKAGLPEPHNQAQMFTITNADMDLFNSFSEGLRNKIASSPEWQSRTTTHASSFKDDPLEDDVPF
jgi:hypothetical protein